jgi:hypothetical protein
MMLEERLVQLVAAVMEEDGGSAPAVGDDQWLVHASGDEVELLLERLSAGLADRKLRSERRLGAVLRTLVERAHSGGQRAWNRLTPRSRSAAVETYRRLGSPSRVRHAILQLLAASRGTDDLRFLVDLLVDDPPADATAAAMAVGGLFQHRDYDARALFPRLFAALGDPSLAPIVMDLANYVNREELLEPHPATGRLDQLLPLLGSLVERLGVIEERPQQLAAADSELSQMVVQSIPLVVSLCDALGLIGDTLAIGKLNQVLLLRHRRLRTEAAAALARLGDENGREVLISLAAEPVARLRVLAYAGELGIADQLEERFTTAVARAEAELACWLAEPTQMGFPPSRLEWVDTKSWYWPGYDEPVECHLFRFVYEMGEREYSGIGIAGPLCHAFAADLADLPPDDIYAVFAGWHAEHAEIREFEVEHWTASQRTEAARLERRLRDAGFDSIQGVLLGSFFGERLLVARAMRDGHAGMVVAAADEIQWLPDQGNRRPLGPQEAFSLFKGRRLLRAFNS